MKNQVLFCLAVSIVALACTRVEDSPEYRQVVHQSDSLVQKIEEQDKELQEFTQEFHRIEQNLSAIDTGRAEIMAISGAKGLGRKDRIHKLIAEIYISLDQNQTTIYKLEERIRKNRSAAALSVLVNSLKENLHSKEEEIALLEKELSALKLEVRNLKEAVAYRETVLREKDTLLARQSDEIRMHKNLAAQKEAELSRVYFVKGTAGELIAAGILKKEGGLAGIGTVKVLGSKLKADQFKVLNAKTDILIPIGPGKKRKVVTTHPADSYFFVAREGRYYMKISYPDRFWSISRYLVVVTD
jgi:hypothetical protein